MTRNPEAAVRCANRWTPPDVVSINIPVTGRHLVKIRTGIRPQPERWCGHDVTGHGPDGVCEVPGCGCQAYTSPRRAFNRKQRRGRGIR